MHIFIDESGLFSVKPTSPTWSTVGGVAIPDASLEKVKKSLEKLKILHGIEVNDEFKRDRPDCTSEAYQEFLKSLDKAECTFHALSTISANKTIEQEELKAHRSATVSAIISYASREKNAAPHSEEVIELIESLSQQEYNQCIFQSQMICDFLPKIISHYAGILPNELGRFNWVIDRKSISENKYEKCFKALYIGIVIMRSARQASAILDNRDYSAFNREFSPDANKIELLKKSKNLTGIDRTNLAKSIIPVSFGKILEKEFSFEDSMLSIGLQVADLLTSSLNRCLKQNYTDNKKMALALGRLMINAPRIEERSLMVMGHGHQQPIAKAPGELIELIDSSSKKLYSQEFRVNFSRNFPGQ
jgi:UDP-2,3-diacylglucosamine pyrophosphatase LpxH